MLRLLLFWLSFRVDRGTCCPPISPQMYRQTGTGRTIAVHPYCACALLTALPRNVIAFSMPLSAMAQTQPHRRSGSDRSRSGTPNCRGPLCLRSRTTACRASLEIFPEHHIDAASRLWSSGNLEGVLRTERGERRSVSLGKTDSRHKLGDRVEVGKEESRRFTCTWRANCCAA